MNEKDPKKPDKPHLFTVGKVANPNGRPKGSPNKITTQMKETMHQIFLNNTDRIQEDLDALEPKDRLNFISKLFPYFMPALTATKSEVTHKHTGAEHLSNPELHKLILTFNIPIENAEYTDNTEHTESE